MFSLYINKLMAFSFSGYANYIENSIKEVLQYY